MEAVIARNGSGTYSLPQPPFTPGTTIASSAVNSDLSDIGAALTQSISKDGQTVYTGNQPMGGNKLTGLGAGTSPNDSVRVSQVADGKINYGGVAGGTADDITLAPVPGISAYEVGQTFTFTAASDNTGAMTADVSAVGDGPLLWPDGTTMGSGDIQEDGVYEIAVAATTPIFHLQTSSKPPVPRTGGTMTGTLAMSGAAINEAATSLGVTNPLPIGATPANTITVDGGGESSVVTITIANPAVVSWTAHGLPQGTGVQFGTTGALPTGLLAATTYYVFAPTTDAFNVSSVPVGSGSTVTITIASPGVVSLTSHGFANGTKIIFSTTGALPTGLTAGTAYYVVSANTNDFQVAATVGGSAINTTGTQSGTHSVVRAIGTSGSQSGTQTATTPATVSAFDTVQAGTIRRLIFASIITLTYNATSLILPTKSSITTAVGDVGEFVSLGGGNWRCFNYVPANGAPVSQNRAYAEYTTYATLAPTIPSDDTIPQVSEGSQILSVAITPKSTVNRVRVLVQAPIGLGSGGSPDNACMALFRNGGANAIASTFIRLVDGSTPYPAVINFEDVPGATTAQTYTVRVGANTANVNVNGVAAGRLGGGSSRATIILEEIPQ